ncbi:hypothetical protein PCLA_10r0141 [Pseudomonas citronellolis]|nr:hypothetical protein PCLA_10r0141 [Pseudomonas citronellolis]
MSSRLIRLFLQFREHGMTRKGIVPVPCNIQPGPSNRKLGNSFSVLGKH